MPSLTGLVAVDLTGAAAGWIDATHPYDGSEPEFAVVRVVRGTFGESHLVPLAGCVVYHDSVQFPYTLAEIAEAPSTACSRWEFEQIDYARAYW